MANPHRTWLQRLLGGHSFRDPQLQDVLLGGGREDMAARQRLEFLGDAVIGLVVGEELFRRFPDGDQAFLSQARSQMVSSRALARLAARQGAEAASLSQKQLADGVEICLGALYLDAGLEQARGMVLRWLADDLEQVQRHGILHHPKTQLKEYLEARGEDGVQYSFEEMDEGAHRVHAQCVLAGREYRQSVDCARRRDGEEQAAAGLLRQMLERE